MKTTTVLLNGLLALALAGVGNAYAVDEPVLTREEIRAQHREATANMTEAEREQYRLEQQSKMTDEQRDALRAEKTAQKKQKKEKKYKSEGTNGSGSGTMLRDGSGAGSQRGSQGGMGR